MLLLDQIPKNVDEYEILFDRPAFFFPLYNYIECEMAINSH